ncbi:MAG TPA: type II secretion system F family protein [Candidatus Paceibacterota bacterium]|jgi:type IV pilus assembly protein PilC|nr:type II secretion system F family protein [Candidatus Paceibacterota bacterium]
MLYHYLAVDASGKTVESDFEASSLDEVLHYLSGKELRPISVKPLKQKSAGQIVLFGGINTSDKVFLTKYLALMLRVGTDLLSAINILIADFDKPSVKNFLLEVHDNLSKGMPFYEAFARHPKVFSPIFVNLVKAAETSGNLEKTFQDLSTSLEKDAALQSSIRSALIYPIVVIAMAMGIMIFLVTFALPKLAAVFDGGGINPPAFSELVFTVGLFVGNNIILLLVLFFGIIAGVAALVFFTETGKRLWSTAVTNLPVIRKIYSDIAVQRMASTMSSLMKAGLPITETITVAAETVGHHEFHDALLRVANEGLAKGLTIGESFKREPAFPKVVTNLVAISEKAGHLEEVLDTLSSFYEANIDANIKALVSLLEPMLLLGLGAMVAVIALSIIVPIYQLTASF